MKHDPLRMVRSDLLNRIELLERDCAILTLHRLCAQLAEIRGIARRYGMEPIERLASLLGSVVAFNDRRQIAITYLARMHDAAEGEMPDHHATDVVLAAAALRGCRQHG